MIKQAIYVPNFGDWGNVNLLAELASKAEETGFDGLFLWDHLNITGADGLDTVDPSVALAVIARETSKIKFGPIVTPLARRRPWKLARELVTLDHLSKGRLVFGAGLGEPAELEFSAFGEESDGKVRARKLDEGLAILDGLVQGKVTNFSGECYHIQDVRFKPKSIQEPRFPIWIAATLPHVAGVKRSLRWDGIFPVVMPEENPMVWANWFPTLSDFEAVVKRVRTNLTKSDKFDFVASGMLGDKGCKGASFEEYARVGASWWLHWVDETPGTFGETLRKIVRGPIG